MTESISILFLMDSGQHINPLILMHCDVLLFSALHHLIACLSPGLDGGSHSQKTFEQSVLTSPPLTLFMGPHYQNLQVRPKG